MKLLCTALCACALTACALDDEDNLQTTTQEEKRVPLFAVDISFAGVCSDVTLLSNWSVAEPDAVYVRYSILDINTNNAYQFDSTIIANGTNIESLPTDLLTGITKGAHRFRIEARLLDADLLPLFEGSSALADSLKSRLPCQLVLR